MRCARRRWLLGKLSVVLDFRAREQSRFWSLLELSDLELIDAIGGRRRTNLHREYACWVPEPTQQKCDTAGVCRHQTTYPSSLRDDPLAPHSIDVRGGVARLSAMLERKVVAIVGTSWASDYGMETARALARGLAASGVTVASGLAGGIPTAVHRGALEGHGATLTAIAGGLERCSPASCRELYRGIIDTGCAISETPSSLPIRRWMQAARARTLALLSELVIVVEASEQPWELACARAAQAHGTPVAAVPGRVNSSASKGTNSLLMNGAQMVRNPQDALDVLYGVGVHELDAAVTSLELQPRLRYVFERVGDGQDTLTRLTANGAEPGEIAVALAELELRGLLLRGDGGRYLPNAAPLTGNGVDLRH
jgi:DNA processing protein